MFKIFIIAISMSADAFAASLAKGATLQRPSLKEALRTGAIFGLVETVTPFIGWLCGAAASSFVAAIDHWIAFFLLGAIGLHMIAQCFTCDKEEQKRNRHSSKILIATAIATSIDALAIGVTLAFIDIDIVIAALAIGLSTFVMVTLGVMISRMVGPHLGRYAEGAGGLLLIGIGTFILLEHLQLI